MLLFTLVNRNLTNIECILLLSETKFSSHHLLPFQWAMWISQTYFFSSLEPVSGTSKTSKLELLVVGFNTHDPALKIPFLWDFLFEFWSISFSSCPCLLGSAANSIYLPLLYPRYSLMEVISRKPLILCQIPLMLTATAFSSRERERFFFLPQQYQALIPVLISILWNHRDVLGSSSWQSQIRTNKSYNSYPHSHSGSMDLNIKFFVPPRWPFCSFPIHTSVLPVMVLNESLSRKFQTWLFGIGPLHFR